MNDLLRPPADRELPPARAARMRADLLNRIRPAHRTSRPPRRLRLVAATAAVVVAAAGLPALLSRTPDRSGALPPSASAPFKRGPALAPPRSPLDRTLASIVDECLRPTTSWSHRNGPGSTARPFPVTADDVTAAAQSDGHAAALFFTDAGFLACELPAAGGDPAAVTYGEWATEGFWLHGHVMPFFATFWDKTDRGGMALGRVSNAVDRLELTEGGERGTPVTINDGGFALVATGDFASSSLSLVAYDSNGSKIYEWPLDPTLPAGPAVQCYTDAAGKIFYPDDAESVADPRTCLPGVPWAR